jgi:hypothetical protein
LLKNSARHKGMLKTTIHFVLLALVCGAGGWLQWHEHFRLSGLPSAWAFLGALFPYVLCVVVAMRSESVVPAIAGATFALLLDGIAHYDVFVRPNGSTAVLAFLFVPLWSTVVFVPLTMVITRAIMRRREAKRAMKREEQPITRRLEPRLRAGPAARRW